ncbi:DNA-packaging protein [Enterovirga rhinocerotis]|uniref:Phage terminase large subunit-like protein n=1 Tax=Enterovirga rhinocerotis TaxID=1339210 RepID=A0A4R7BTA3_9HYPH|nr:terminase family protein [Enterovirga rhinocerotis]TDR88950.1 phage terminase large subunit-like protein [Enterovirga rhinocerotis]
MPDRPRAALPSCATSFVGISNAYGTKAEQGSGIEALELTRREAERLLELWHILSHPNQIPPEDGAWTTWLLLGGRGAGKTRTGAEWIRGAALGQPGFLEPAAGRIALVGETHAAVRDVMIEGPSGLLAIHALRRERLAWLPSLRRLEWPNGAIAHSFSSEDPDGLRGPQFGAAWADELAKWRHPDETWDMLQFGLRLGREPRQVVTTTPRPIPLLKRLLADRRTIVSRMTTQENAKHLAPAFLQHVVGLYAGTRLGRQELDGEMIEERQDALWSRNGIEAVRIAAAPDLVRIVVAVDPPASSGLRADACGIVVAGTDEAGTGHVLADASLERAKPAEWAAKAVAAYRRWHADALVAEANQGGEMVAAILREVDPGIPVVSVRATRGKYLRAEPVALLYEQGRVRHVGAVPALEDEMVDFSAGGLSSGRSPDRLDALVWALSDLMLRPKAEPRLRML